MFSFMGQIRVFFAQRPPIHENLPNYATFITITRGLSPDNVKFCQPVIIGNQYNFTSFLPDQKTSIRTKVMDDQKVEKAL